MTHCEIHPLHDVADYIKKEIPEHYQEACKTNEYEPVDIDWDYFINMSFMGSCFVVLLKDGEKSVGYTIMTVSNDPLRKSITEANNVCMYVKKAYRGIGTTKLIKKSQGFMKALGAVKVNYMVKNKALSKLLAGFGAKQEEQLWGVSL